VKSRLSCIVPMGGGGVSSSISEKRMEENIYLLSKGDDCYYRGNGGTLNCCIIV